MNHSIKTKRRWSLPLCVCVLVMSVGCESHTSGSTESDTKTRIESLFNLYKSYVDTKKKAPANEKALREYAKQLTEQQLDELLISRDLDSIFISDRDKEPFQIVYGKTLNPGGEPVAVIYEKTGANGTKFAALTIGYAEEYDEETLGQYLPKRK